MCETTVGFAFKSIENESNELWNEGKVYYANGRKERFKIIRGNRNKQRKEKWKEKNRKKKYFNIQETKDCDSNKIKIK